MQIFNNHDGSTGKLSTSKGNQIKMKINNVWYKMDYLGYEGLSEYLCATLLPYTNISSYAKYELQEMSLNGETYNGCSSYDFLKKNEEIITADKLFKVYQGSSVQECLTSFKTIKEQISFFVNTVTDITGIKNYGAELTKLLEWDSFILNDDRHFNNIAFTYDSETKIFAPCVLFDNGAAFLSDLRYDYPLEKNIYGLIAGVKAKPFSTAFDNQVQVCEELFGSQLRISEDICISDDVKQKILTQYGEKITNRVCEIFTYQKSLSDYLCPSNTLESDSFEL